MNNDILPTPKQVAFLKQLGEADAQIEKLNRVQAIRRIQHLIDNPPATEKQKLFLRGLGRSPAEIETMSKEEARGLISSILRGTSK